MSFPNIPDIKPDIKITLEDALNLLLTSIALEEISLSELMKAETKKILFILDESKCKDSALQDAIAINKSVNETIKNMIKLQMLLQFKLENVSELLPSTTTTTTTTTMTTTTTCTQTSTTATKSTSTSTTHTTTCTTSTSTTTTKKNKKCGCSLTGEGRGCVSNPLDKFYYHPVILKACIRKCCLPIHNTLCYSIKSKDETLCMTACSDDLCIECPCPLLPDRLVVCGRCCIEKISPCHSCVSEVGYFILKVWNRKLGNNGFQMIITSTDNPKLNHDSGFVHMINSCLCIDQHPIIYK